MFYNLLSTTITAGSGTTTSSSSSSLFSTSNPAVLVIGYCVLLFAVMYFFSIRPNKKKEQQLAEQRNAIAVGDSIVTNNGMFGKVVDVTYECFIVEFGMNKGVRVPVLKGEVFAKREPNLSNEAPVVEEAPVKKKGLFSRKKDEE
ncbi:preprotein translocase subunit YajC [Chakrabartyella piscis]|uniref:preprotein translocase subunit YajC n=1 Tax=Chakrabartyella piscis TaxID=2918914 RepID=UPI0029587896|nr:preprotein translocase subunit YajC [Chakrabartyella piscis]